MLYKKRFDDVFNKKMVMQQAIFSLEDNFQNQSIMNALKELNAFTNNNKMYHFCLFIHQILTIY